MPKLVRWIVSVVARRLRSRAAVELENLALRHQPFFSATLLGSGKVLIPGGMIIESAMGVGFAALEPPRFIHREGSNDSNMRAMPARPQATYCGSQLRR